VTLLSASTVRRSFRYRLRHCAVGCADIASLTLDAARGLTQQACPLRFIPTGHRLVRVSRILLLHVAGGRELHAHVDRYRERMRFLELARSIVMDSISKSKSKMYFVREAIASRGSHAGSPSLFTSTSTMRSQRLQHCSLNSQPTKVGRGKILHETPNAGTPCRSV
jgi:hypothetical protein